MSHRDDEARARAARRGSYIRLFFRRESSCLFFFFLLFFFPLVRLPVYRRCNANRCARAEPICVCARRYVEQEATRHTRFRSRIPSEDFSCKFAYKIDVNFCKTITTTIYVTIMLTKLAPLDGNSVDRVVANTTEPSFSRKKPIQPAFSYRSEGAIYDRADAIRTGRNRETIRPSFVRMRM